MIAIIKRNLPSKLFFKTSSIAFIANFFTAVVSYLIIIIASRELNNIANWTSVNSITAILTMITIGMSTEFAKKSASLSEKSIQEAGDYYTTIKIGIQKYNQKAIILFSILSIASLFVSSKGYLVITLVILSFFIQIKSKLNVFFLTGLLKMKDFAINTMLIAVVRLIGTSLMLKYGLEVVSLPLGIIFSIAIGHIHSEIVIKRILDKIGYKAHAKLAKEHTKLFKKQLSNLFQTTSAMFILNTTLQITPIISVYMLNYKNADLFAIVYSIGQIIHFGSTSFLSLLSTFTAKKKESKNLVFSIIFTILSTIFAGIVTLVFKDFILEVFKRKEYTNNTKEILFYIFYILVYNIVFIISRYIIGANYNRLIRPLILVPIIISGLAIALQKTVSTFDFIKLITLLMLISAGYLITILHINKNKLFDNNTN